MNCARSVWDDRIKTDLNLLEIYPLKPILEYCTLIGIALFQAEAKAITT